MIKVVFFDLDGVLVEVDDWHYQALNPRTRLSFVPTQEQKSLKTSTLSKK